MTAEAIWRLTVARRGYDFAAAAASLAVHAGDILARGLAGGVIATVYAALHAMAPYRWPLDDWRAWIAAFFVVEFAYYWFHRWSHTVRWLWATHAVHHSAQEMTLPAAVRLGWTGLLSGGWLVFTLLALLGLPPLMTFGLLAANLLYQFVLHTEAVGRLGPLEWVLNTPSHHRVHHASNASLLDKNFGGVLIVYDRLFGTFAAEPENEPLRYGLTHGLASHNPFVIALHEWARMVRDIRKVRSPSELLRATFGRPQ
jgi:sterol desaturase/sphingolipid hydroxylase (fatty acid hydroxylase superfamily)